MRVPVVLLAQLAFAFILTAEAPIYSAESLVNSADNQSGWLAPNAIATLYGKNLAYGTKTLTASDIRGGVLPTVLPNTGVRVLVNGLPANPYYVSPTQINFLVPPNLLPGPSTVQVVIDGLAGPQVPVTLFFSWISRISSRPGSMGRLLLQPRRQSPAMWLCFMPPGSVPSCPPSDMVKSR
jgi:hypothetical protein